MTTFKFNASAGVILCPARIASADQSTFVKMAVDTGASITMIPQEHALAVGLNPDQSKRTKEIATANGKILVPVITIPVFECMGVRIHRMDVICHNLPVGAVEGLLGLNFLVRCGAVFILS